MRIVHITDTYPPRSHPIAGQVAELARRQGARGDAVHVLAASPLDAAEPGRSRFRASTTDAPGVRVHRLASPLSFGLPVLPRGRAMVERALGLLRPDVVHLHLPGPSPFAYDAARAARGTDLPLAITAYSGAPETFAKYAVRIAGWATAPVATSGVNGHVAALSTEVFGDATPRVLPLGVDLAPWHGAARRWEEHEDLRVLLHACDRTKRIAPGVSAAQQRAGDRLTVTVIGTNASAVTRPDVLLGDVPAQVVPALASDHDVYLSAAALDPHLAGAAAAGLALVSHQDTSGPDLIGGGGIEGEAGARAGGFLVDTAADVERALTHLAESRELRRRMRDANSDETHQRELANHDWANVLALADALYGAARDQVNGFFG